MPEIRTENCPKEEILHDFLLGKLDPKSSLDCELHLSQCQPCVETISAIDVGDTFQAMVIDSRKNDQRHSAAEDSIVNNLVQRLSVLSAVTSSAVTPKGSGQRAADVVSQLEPVEESDFLGKLDHFLIVGILGVGSSGVVFRAVDSQLNRDVAIKVLRPSLGQAARGRFIAEARATANLDHPNIVRIFHVGTTDSLAYIVMQWLPGETLDQRLERNQALPHAEVRRLGVETSRGLAMAHEKDLVHRDIKPANLWITDGGAVKILDFGLVRMMDENPQLTCTGMIAGTPCFMSPEQSRGDELDLRSDLFSLGCVLYQSLTGKLPFASNNALATLQAVQREQPMPPREFDAAIPTDLSDLVMMLLEKSPHRRPATAEILAKALETERKHWPFVIDCYESTKDMRTANHLDAHLHTAPSRICNKFWPLIGLAMSAVLLGVAGWLFGPQIFRIATDQGQILIESNDPNVQIEVSQSGELVEVIDLRTRQSVQIKSGTYQIHTVGDENTVTIDKDQLTLSRGETEIVQIQKNSELAKSAKSTSQFSASEPATSDIQDYEPSQPQRLTESVYNGMTLGECMNKIKYERNHEHLVAPLHAMFFISDPEFQPELVEPVTNAMLLFDFGWSHNPTGPFQLVQPYTDWLSNEQLQKVAIELSASDDFNHWGLLYGMLESASYSNRWTRSGADVQKELLRNIRHTISQESQVKEQALDVYLVLVDIEVFDPREHDELLQLVLEHTHRKAIFNAINDFDILAMASPDLHGLGAAIGKFIAKDRSSSSTNEINPDEGSDLILKLDRNNQKKAIVEFAKRLFSDQVTAEQPIAVEMLLKLDEDVFELVRPIYEAHKSNVNGILMTNSLKKAGRDR